MKHDNFVHLSEHLWVYKEETMLVGVLHNEGKALIFDIGEGKVLEFLEALGIKVEGILLTHHHRDIAFGAWIAGNKGSWIGVPEKESYLFENVEKYWQEPTRRWHLYYFRPNFVLTNSIQVHKHIRDGCEFSFGTAKITALSTPGHTDGSVTYIVEVDDKRFAFCGDLIYDKGKIHDVYSLQKGFEGLTDYHGFMFAWYEVLNSLKKLINYGVDIIIPSRGAIIYQPEPAIDLLEKRVRECYDNYLSTSALWYYFPHLLAKQTRTRPLISARKASLPPFLQHIGTSWMLISEDKSAFVMDCGSLEVIQQIEQLIKEGKIKGVEVLWITHTHDDHTDAINQFRQRFCCRVIAEDSVAKVVSLPSAWKLPCLSPNSILIDRIVKHSESWQWKEFTLTAYHFPGQSLYHSGLLVEGKGLRLFFCGDSFTPTGIDDYCAFNRNFLGKDRGYEFCLNLLETIKPDMIFNSHISEPFVFSSNHLKALKKQLRTRWKLFKEIFPWDDPNYGIDPYWAYCYPYEQEGREGEVVMIEVVIINHLHQSIRCSARLNLPPFPEKIEGIFFREGEAKPKDETKLPLFLTIPTIENPVSLVLTVDVDLNGMIFPQFADCVIKVVKRN